MDKRTLHDVLGHADELIALREHVHSLLSTLDAHAVVEGVGVQGVDTRFFQRHGCGGRSTLMLTLN